MVATLGTFAIGTLPIAGGETYGVTPPAVTVTAPTAAQVISTGGPEVTVEWTYTQAELLDQGAYRVEFTNDAGTIVYLDSGWQTGTDVSYTADLIAAGIASDATNLAVRVSAYPETSEFTATTSALVEFDLLWGVPEVVVTAPDASVTTSTTDTTWTYSDSQANAQEAYRVRLLLSEGQQLWDSGIIVGTETTTDVPYILSDGGNYVVGVRARNSMGVWSAEATRAFTTQLDDPALFDDVPDVGRVYEIGINGVGYMLADNPATPEMAWQRQMVPLDVQRFATSETPFSESIERYVFSAWPTWRGGTGQFWSDRPDSSQSSYWDSLGVNPFEEGTLSLLPACELTVASTFSTIRAVVASDKMYVQTGTEALSYIANPGGTASVLDLSTQTAATLTDLTTDGQYWYASDGLNIYRGTTSVPGGAWSTQNAQTLSFAGQRICATVKAGSSATPNVWTTLDEAGAEEVGSGRLILDEGWTIGKSTGNTGYVWFPASSTYQGLIYVWPVGSTDAPAVAWELPVGLEPTSVFAYQGNVFVLATAGDGTSLLYRCQVDQTGALIPFLQCEDLPDTSAAFGADGRFVFFAWPETDTERDGLGCVDLSSGGGCRWLHAPGGGGEVRSIGSWRGRTWWACDSVGVYLESQDELLTEGWLETSLTDKNSSVIKVWDTLTLQAFPMVGGESIAAEVTMDAGATYEPVPAADMSTAGERTRTAALAKRSASCGVRVTLRGDGTATPGITLIQLRGHPIGLADEVIQLPINCFDNAVDLNSRKIASYGKGSGVERYQRLRNLQGTRVKFQDITWALTGVSEICEVVSVQARGPSLKDRNVARTAQGLTALVLLRKLHS
jgi:hypothetical protein